MGSFNLPNWVSQLAAIMAVLSDFLVAITAILGIFGINLWRKQLQFGDQYKTAHRIMGLALRFKREFGLARLNSPVIEIGKSGFPEMEPGTRILEIQNDFNYRQKHMMRLFDIVEKLYEESLDVEGVLGEEESGLTIPLETLYRLLNEDFSEYTRFVQSLNPRTSAEYLQEGIIRNENILFSSDDDQLTNNVAEAIKVMRKKLKKYLS